MTPTCYIAIAVVAYLIGGVPFGLLIGRFRGIDIRTRGSGNIGATNVTRIIGKPWGVLCFVLDFGKGFGPTAAALWLAAARGLDPSYAAVLGAVGSVCGHIFCPYLKFRGGKGIATSAGALMAIAAIPVLIAFAVWLGVLLVWRYVGLASVCAAVALPVSAVALSRVDLPGQRLDVPVLIMLAALGALAIFRHRSNLQRIMAGTEAKIGAKKNDRTTDEDNRPE